MSDYEASLIDQLDDYKAFCYDNHLNMDTKFPLLECTKEDFNWFKRSLLNSLSVGSPSKPLPSDNLNEPQQDMPRSTKGQHNLSRPSISPASIGSTSSSSIETSPSISSISKGEGGSLKCSSYSLNGEGNSSSYVGSPPDSY